MAQQLLIIDDTTGQLDCRVDPCTLVQGCLPTSSTTVPGIVELADNAEAVAATDATRALTPAGLAAYIAANPTSIANATETSSGVAELATVAEAVAGTDTTRIVTPAGLAAAIAAAPCSCPNASTTTAGLVELATEAEAVAGTSTTLAVTPAGLSDALDNIDVTSLDFSALPVCP